MNIWHYRLSISTKGKIATIDVKKSTARVI